MRREVERVALRTVGLATRAEVILRLARNSQVNLTMARRAPKVSVFTIGHSTRPLEAFVEMLKAHGVEVLADVRTVPRSRHNPQFDKTTLPKALRSKGIRYVHLPRLGGLRHGLGDESPNKAWRNASFRGYADYMQTEEFEEGLSELMTLAAEAPTAIMCAEAVPYRCHRSLIADALIARGAGVLEISSKTRAAPHRMTPFAKLRGGHVTYPSE